MTKIEKEKVVSLLESIKDTLSGLQTQLCENNEGDCGCDGCVDYDILCGRFQEVAELIEFEGALAPLEPVDCVAGDDNEDE